MHALVLLLGCGPEYTSQRFAEELTLYPPEAPWDQLQMLGEVCVDSSWDERALPRENCVETFGRCGEDRVCHPVNPTKAVAVEGEALIALLPEAEGYGWAPEEWLEPGEYQLVLIENDLDVRAQQLFFTIEPYTAPAAGTWSVHLRGSLLADMASTYLPLETWLVLDEPDDQGRVEFAVVGRYDDLPQCVFLRGQGTHDLEQGFTWEAQELNANTEPPARSYDVELRAWFLADGTGVGGEAHALIDTRHFDSYENTASICPFIELYGEDCTDPCPDGEPECLQVDAAGMPLRPDVPIDIDQLPPCGFDASSPEAQWSCDFEWPEGGLCSAAGVLSVSWPVALLALALTRRRRR